MRVSLGLKKASKIRICSVSLLSRPVVETSGESRNAQLVVVSLEKEEIKFWFVRILNALNHLASQTVKESCAYYKLPYSNVLTYLKVAIAKYIYRVAICTGR